VQFVKFNDFLKNSDELVKEVLKEIPAQMAKYFKSNLMWPNLPRQNNVGAQFAYKLAGQAVSQQESFFMMQKGILL
jgi:hypothetical protein